MWNGGKMGDGFFDGYPEMDFGGGLKALPMKEIGESLNVIGSGINTQRSDAIAANTDTGGGGGSTIINNVSSPTNTQIQTQIGTESPQLGSVTHGNGSQADALRGSLNPTLLTNLLIRLSSFRLVVFSILRLFHPIMFYQPNL